MLIVFPVQILIINVSLSVQLAIGVMKHLFVSNAQILEKINVNFVQKVPFCRISNV
jgi:hypothetical protein